MNAIAAAAVAVCLLAAPPIVSEKPAPYPREVVQAKIAPWTVAAYEASYGAKLQNAQLSADPEPDATATRGVADHRMREYPGHLKLAQKEEALSPRVGMDRKRARPPAMAAALQTCGPRKGSREAVAPVRRSSRRRDQRRSHKKKKGDITDLFDRANPAKRSPGEGK